MNRPHARAGAAAGFTLIELLIVIAIVGTLAAFFLPDIIGAREQGNVSTTIANMQRLGQGCDNFERRFHFYPPDDLRDPEKKLQFKSDNGVNTGIESLVAFLSQSVAAGADLSEFPLGNTDGDKDDKPLPVLNRSDRLEVLDAWGMPLVYFSKTTETLGFEKPQTVATPEGGRVTVKAMRNSEGRPVGTKFQLLSAGQDGEFGTDDDLSWPERQ
ncbi:MAG: type II secretion system protein [Planctomycetota bacterium]